MSAGKAIDPALHAFESGSKPLPSPTTSSANPSASLPALWGYLQPALDHIIHSPTKNLTEAPSIEVSYHIGLHTAVYDYFMSQSESGGTTATRALLPIPSRRSDANQLGGTDLYAQLDQYYAEAAKDILYGAPPDDSTLIPYLLPRFSRYTTGAQSVNRLLGYVNRHYVERAVEEDKGWLRPADFFDLVAESIQEDDTRDTIQRHLQERRTEELKKWGYYDGASTAVLAQAEACAEAASPLDRIVPLSSLAHRRFRSEVIDPLLAVPKPENEVIDPLLAVPKPENDMKMKKKKKKKKPTAPPEKPAVQGSRLSRAVNTLLEGENCDAGEKRRLAGELAILLRTVGVRFDHSLQKKLDKFILQNAT